MEVKQNLQLREIFSYQQDLGMAFTTKNIIYAVLIGTPGAYYAWVRFLASIISQVYTY